MDTNKRSIPEQFSRKNVVLTVRADKATESTLVFKYEVENQSRRVIYLFALLYRTTISGEAEADPNLVYSFLDETARVLRFSKELLHVPPWALVESPEVPYLIRMEPSEKFRETIRVPLPLRIHDPYDDNYPDKYRPRAINVDGFKFAIGIVVDEPNLNLHSSIALGRKVFSVEYGEAIKRQIVIESDLKPVLLKVLLPARIRENEILQQMKR